MGEGDVEVEEGGWKKEEKYMILFSETGSSRGTLQRRPEKGWETERGYKEEEEEEEEEEMHKRVQRERN